MTELFLFEGTFLKAPVVIIVESEKEDIEQFRLLLSAIYSYFIGSDSKNLLSYLSERKISSDALDEYKKIELFNIIAFITTTLFKPGPHTTIKLKLPFVPSTIDFYFSSNCEIPCNKTDKTISKLFSLLDLSIIIKIVMKILTDHSVLLISSEASVLNVIFPALHKLIFPLKWIYTYIPVLPVVKAEFFIENPMPHLFGILKNELKMNELKYNSDFVVDCDTNEIVSDRKFVDFCPLPSSEFSSQQNVVLTLHNNKLKRYDKNETGRARYKPVRFLLHGKVYIDCNDGNRLVTELQDNYLTDEEAMRLRKSIQHLKKKTYIKQQNEVSILEDVLSHSLSMSVNVSQKEETDMSYEHEINKLFTELIVNKLFNKDDPLLIDIKHSNSFEDFIHAGIYQNDSNFRIVKNLLEGFHDRTIDNAFNVIYTVKPFEGKEKMYSDYRRIREVIASYYEEEGIGNKMQMKMTNFYGDKGVISFLNSFKNNIKDYDTFIKNEYMLPLVDKLLGQEEENIFEDSEEIVSRSKIISFESQNGRPIDECHQYLYYCAVLMNNYKQMYKGDRYNKDDFNYAIVDYHLQAEKKDQVDYSYINFDDYLSTLSFEEINVVLEYLYSKEKDVYPDVDIFIRIAKEKFDEHKKNKGSGPPSEQTIILEDNNN